MRMLSTFVFIAVAATGATEIRRGLEVDSDDGLHVRGARDNQDPAGTTASANDAAGGEESQTSQQVQAQATCGNHFFKNKSNHCPDQLPVEARTKLCRDETTCKTTEFCCEKAQAQATCGNQFFKDKSNHCPDQLPVEARTKRCPDEPTCKTTEFCCEKKTCRNQYSAQGGTCPNRPNNPNGHYMKLDLDKECTNDKDCGRNYCCVPAKKRLPCADFLKRLNGTCPDDLVAVTKPGSCLKKFVNDGVDCKNKCCKSAGAADPVEVAPETGAAIDDTAGAADPVEDAPETGAAIDDEAAEGAGSPEAQAAANVGLM